MNALFATPGMAIASTIVLLLELASFTGLCIGLLSYRHIVLSHRAFFSSLHHAGKQVKQEYTGMLFWLYLCSTIFFIVATSVMYIWQPHLF